MNKGITIHLSSYPNQIGDYLIRLHGNAIIKCENKVISVCDGNYKLTNATKKVLMELLGGSFKGSTYFVNGKAIELSSNWQNIIEG